MDSALLTGGVTGTIMVVAFVAYKLLHNCHFRSTCCGREVSVSTSLADDSKDVQGVANSSNPERSPAHRQEVSQAEVPPLSV